MAKITIDRLGADMNTVASVVNDTAYLQQALAIVWNAAIGKARARDGELKQSIGVSVGKSEDGLTGHVGTNLEYAMYVEFGTGPRGAADHSGVSPDFAVAYKTSPWYIHASQLYKAEETAERYHWQKYEVDGEVFYRTYGSAAHPFLYPALKDNEQVVADTLAGGWENAIRRNTK